MVKKGMSKMGAVMIPVLTFVSILFLLPVWKGIWKYVATDYVSLSYLFFAIGIVFMVLTPIIQSGKRPNLKYWCYFSAIFCVIAAIFLLIPDWFTAVWF